MGIHSEFNILSLCTGAGGLDLGVRLAAPLARTVCYVEREAFVIESLVQKMLAGVMDQAPVWTDLRTFDGKAWRGVVDCIIAGIPCQGNSLAGKRALAADPRNLWPATLRILREVECPLFFLENVPGILIPDRKGGRESPITRILGELAEAGFDAEWDVFSAQEIGATHKRERVFLLAYSKRSGSYSGSERTGREARSDLDRSGERTGVDDSERIARTGRERGSVRSQRKDSEGKTANRSGKSDTILADTRRKGKQRRRNAGNVDRSERGVEGKRVQRKRRRNDADNCLSVVGDATHIKRGQGADDPGQSCALRTSEALGVAQGDSQSFGLEGERADGQQVSSAPDGTRLSLRSSGRVALADGQRTIDIGRIGLFPPRPDEFELWAEVLDIEPSLEPALCRMADGMANRVQRLRACGNGVVPVVAALAFVTLARRLGVYQLIESGEL